MQDRPRLFTLRYLFVAAALTAATGIAMIGIPVLVYEGSRVDAALWKALAVIAGLFGLTGAVVAALLRGWIRQSRGAIETGLVGCGAYYLGAFLLVVSVGTGFVILDGRQELPSIEQLLVAPVGIGFYATFYAPIGLPLSVLVVVVLRRLLRSSSRTQRRRSQVNRPLPDARV